MHPQSVISGTYYVTASKGAIALKLESPRLGLMISARLRKETQRPARSATLRLHPTRVVGRVEVPSPPLPLLHAKFAKRQFSAIC
ncbi:MAG: putative 2OG-Fe(II) oxygenase [Alphaproteobacteria bacterium]|nr:putative 2OG-Fe(II) oxygenase [Alphaproteobacteria bacterium]